MTTLKTSRILTRRRRRPQPTPAEREMTAIRRELDSLRRREDELAAEYGQDHAAFQAGTGDTGAILTRACNRLREHERLMARRWHLVTRLEELCNA